MRQIGDLYESIEMGISEERSPDTLEEAIESAEELGGNASLKSSSIERKAPESPDQGKTKVLNVII